MKDVFFLNFAIDVIIGLKNLFLLSRGPAPLLQCEAARLQGGEEHLPTAQSLVSRHAG